MSDRDDLRDNDGVGYEPFLAPTIRDLMSALYGTEAVGKVSEAYERGTKGQTFPMDLPGFEADDDGCTHRCDHGPEWTHSGCTLRVNPTPASAPDGTEAS